ncbi:MAG TPA: hypothetical protein VFB85_17930 [Vicinamibacterales bacterium]|jgi:hypothetical protein|nr:hypothetical protein [Vicinamibacterales bacterium]
MKSAAAVAIGIMLMGAGMNAQNQSSRTTTQVELTGCVSAQANETGAFTFTDTQTGGKYRLTGKKMQTYAGKMVAVFGGPRKRLAIRGGLWPSPNAAGQAGALDPAQESIARQTGGAASARGDAALPEFNVVRVRTVDGNCLK